MNIKTHGKLAGTVTVPASKSDLHRLIICASLANEITTIKSYTMSQDIKATIGAMMALGANIKVTDEEIVVDPIGFTPNKVQINCLESGSTLRFLLPIVSALGLCATFNGKGKLPQRPIYPLDEQMKNNGVIFDYKGTMPFEVKGKLGAGKYVLSGDVSSQYITGLLFSLPILQGDSEIILTSTLQSKPYVNMTINTLKMFGIYIEETENMYKIKGNQKYISPITIKADGDWSNGAFWLCGGAICGDINIKGLDINSLQGDKEIYKILKKMGANISFKDNIITVKKSKLKAISIDASQIPDLVPILAVTSAFAKGETKIYNAKRLRIKECDRLSAMNDCLLKIGADIREFSDGLIINNTKNLCGGKINSYNDHRIAMAMAIASTICDNDVIIENAMCINKSYPKFYDDFKMLGGTADVINMGK